MCAALGMALLRSTIPSRRLTTAPGSRRQLLHRRRPACFQAMNTVGDAEGKRELVEEQHCLWQACPSLVSAEAWFSPPRPKGNELASLIIPCCNQLEYTRQCLESVLRHTREPYGLPLVDNGSSDGTLGYLEEIRRGRRPARTVVLHNETNRGFVAACNQALEETKGKYVVFRNNERIVTPGWLEGLIGWLMKEWPNAGLVGPVSNGAMDCAVHPSGLYRSGRPGCFCRPPPSNLLREDAGRSPANRLLPACPPRGAGTPGPAGRALWHGLF